MAIFSIGILAVGTLQITSTNSNASARIHTEEYTWVVDRIERLTAWTMITTTRSNGTRCTTSSLLGCPGPYTVSWTVVDDTPVAGAKSIAVTADGAHRRARPITIDFIKAR